MKMNKLLRITMVIDTYGVTTNGTTISTMRYAEALRKRGHTVNIITGSPSLDEYTYTTGYNKFPILYQLSRSQGMPLAKNNTKLLRNVIKDSDIVHFLLPFRIQKKGRKISDILHIPSSSAFHVQPENITSTLYLNNFRNINEYIYRYFRRYYNKFDHIHCPSKMIADFIRERGYTAKLHVISNGVSPEFIPKTVSKPDNMKDKYIILMIGRLSREKRQDLIIKAVKKLEFEKDVQIIFAGKGPWKSTLVKESKGLTNPLIMNFFTQDDLIDIINYSDLYIHASDSEIEAIACIEAFSCGLVPIISDSKTSATNQFALTKHNLFEASNSDSIAMKVSYLYNHQEVVEQLSKDYIEYSKLFQLENSISALENMFYEAIEDFEKDN